MDPTSTDRSFDQGFDRKRCDFCGHLHACYVGGQPAYGSRGEVVTWGLYACLGCLMRASVPGGFESCEGCALPSVSAARGGQREGRIDA